MRRKDVFSLAVAGLLLYMLGNWALPITDPVESNYAETAKEMIAAGDYVRRGSLAITGMTSPSCFTWNSSGRFICLA